MWRLKRDGFKRPENQNCFQIVSERKSTCWWIAIHNYTIFLIPTAMSHLISSLLSSVLLFSALSVFFSLTFFCYQVLPRRYRQTGVFFPRLFRNKISSKSLSSLAQLHALCSKSGLGVFFFVENYIQSCNLQMTITILAPETLYCCALLAFPCHIVMITCVGWWFCFYARTVAPFSFVLSLRRKRKSFFLSHPGIKWLLLFLCEIR